MCFSNKHIIVTGDANGIGRCAVEAFLRECATVAVIDIDRRAGEILQNQHDGLRFYHGDIAEKIDTLLGRVWKPAFGEISRKFFVRLGTTNAANPCGSQGRSDTAVAQKDKQNGKFIS